MTESGVPLSGPAAVPDGVSGGMLLRQAREAQGLHVAALAVALKVPVRKLEALEAGRIDLLPDAVFARALASSVCRTLRIDPQPILARLPLTATPRLVQDRDGINTPFRPTSDVGGATWRDQMSRPVVLGVLGLLVAALVLIFMPRLQLDEGFGWNRPDAGPQPVRMGEPVSEPGPAEPPVPVSSPAAAAPVSVAPAVAAPVAAPVAGPVAPPVAASAAPTEIVVFKTRSLSWVEVTDAKGTIAMRRLLGAGESAGVSGALPLSVTIGKASATEVQVRGKAFDLASYSRDDVARFEVR